MTEQYPEQKDTVVDLDQITLNEVIRAVMKLQPDDRRRVILTVCEFFGVRR